MLPGPLACFRSAYAEQPSVVETHCETVVSWLALQPPQLASTLTVWQVPSSLRRWSTVLAPLPEMYASSVVVVDVIAVPSTFHVSVHVPVRPVALNDSRPSQF